MPMKPLSQFPASAARAIRYVLTDVDDTLTCRGSLSAAAYLALERLRDAGIIVVPVTAAPCGWCDVMARMWPVGGVIGENGGVYLHRGGDNIDVRFWLSPRERARSMAQLRLTAEAIAAAIPNVQTAADQPYRQTSWAISTSAKGAERSRAVARVVAAWRDARANVTINSLWVLGWNGDFDKLAMAKVMMAEVFCVDLDLERERVIYVGDSLNDEPMFKFFPHAVAVSTIGAWLDQLTCLPSWVANGPGGTGFVEVADSILSSR